MIFLIFCRQRWPISASDLPHFREKTSFLCRNKSKKRAILPFGEGRKSSPRFSQGIAAPILQIVHLLAPKVQDFRQIRPSKRVPIWQLFETFATMRKLCGSHKTDPPSEQQIMWRTLLFTLTTPIRRSMLPSFLCENC